MTQNEWNKLVKKAMAGDQAAFEDLYKAKIKTILLQASKLVFNPSLVDDAVQEVVVKMYRNIGQLSSPEAFNVWMYRIILNTCYRFNAQNAPRASSLEENTKMLEEHETRYLPAEALEEADRNRIIAQAVNSLPERQRLALSMHYYEDMSYKEIAQVLGITVSGVAANLLKAKKTLKMKLAPTENKNGSGTTLLGIAFLPALRCALQADAQAIATPQRVEIVTEKCAQSLASAGPPTVAGTASGAMHWRKIVLAVAAVLALGALRFGYLEAAHPISATIVMDNVPMALSEHVTPLAMHIDIHDDGGEVLLVH